MNNPILTFLYETCNWHISYTFAACNPAGHGVYY